MHIGFDVPKDQPTWYQDLRAGLSKAIQRRGHTLADAFDPAAKLVFHPVEATGPHPFLKKQRSTFSVGVTSLETQPERLLADAYPLLVRSMSNSLVVMLPPPHTPLWVITPELGCYPVEPDEEGDLFCGLFDRLAPMALSHLVIDNRFEPDLPPELWSGTPQTRELSWASRVIDSWGLLPAPFPIKDLLSPKEWRYLKHLYGIGGLSYGNFSIRHEGTRFWMSASGVNKGHLVEIGTDILLVKGYDEKAQAMVLSIPEGVTPRRVSVDAVEHHMIYSRFPSVQAMVHVHGWVPGVPVTRFNYPCGTVEAGEEVAALLERSDDPGRTIVGMKNHGITATGPDFHDIVARLEGVIQLQVPMKVSGE